MPASCVTVPHERDTMNRRPAKNDARTKNALAASARVRGLERAEHFANGGTLAAWRGVHTCTKNGRANADKNACRRGNW